MCSILQLYRVWDGQNPGVAEYSFGETSSPFPPDGRDQPRQLKAPRSAPVHCGVRERRRLLAPMLTGYVFARGEKPDQVVGYDWSGYIWNYSMQGILSVGIFEGQWRYSGLLCLIVDTLSSSRCRREFRLIYMMSQCLTVPCATMTRVISVIV